MKVINFSEIVTKFMTINLFLLYVYQSKIIVNFLQKRVTVKEILQAETVTFRILSNSWFVRNLRWNNSLFVGLNIILKRILVLLGSIVLVILY